MQHHSWRSALGSIGGGNHFAERSLGRSHRRADSFALSGLQKRGYYCWYTVVSTTAPWSGTKLSCVVMWRRFRITVCRKIATMRAATLRNMTMLAFARSNRALIARRILQQLRAEGEPRLDVAHNFVEPCTVAGEAGWLHRKARYARWAGTGDYPGSRGDYSGWWKEPVSSARRAFSPTAHGAEGRKWMRTECRRPVIGKIYPRSSAVPGWVAG